MEPNEKSSDAKKNEERIDLNNYNRREESNAISEHSDQSIKNLDKTLDEDMGGTDSVVTSKPNYT